MRPAEFTTDEIIAAGDALQAAGRNVTGFALRQKIGGGNPNRLKQVWDEHLASKTAAQAEPVAELPVEVAEEVGTVTKALTERISALAIELNDKAVKAAERRIGAIVRAAGEQREQAERELVDAAQTVDELENKLDEALTEAAGWRTQFSVLTQTHQAQAVELAQVRERLALTEQSAKTADQEHAAELSRLSASIEAERHRDQQQAEQMRSDLAEQKKAVQDAAAERDQARAELATVKAKAEAAEQTHQEQRKAVAQETHRTAERLLRVETGRDEARKEAGLAREEVARLTGQVQIIDRQNAALMATLGQKPIEAAKPKK